MESPGFAPVWAGWRETARTSHQQPKPPALRYAFVTYERLR